MGVGVSLQGLVLTHFGGGLILFGVNICLGGLCGAAMCLDHPFVGDKILCSGTFFGR